VRKHFRDIGFSNRLAIYALIFLFVGLCGGFVLAIYSIRKGYTGSLICWTVAFTPLGALIGSVPGLVIKKSEAENTGASAKQGEGIKYASAKAADFKRDSCNPKI